MFIFHLRSFQKLAAIVKSDRRSLSGMAVFLVCGRSSRLFYGVVFALVPLLIQSTLAVEEGQPFVLHERFERQDVQNQPERKMTHGIVGFELLIQHGKFPMVQGVFPGTPAAIRGLLPGDQILAINGIATMGKSATEVDTLISDVPGERVLFSIQRGARHAQVTLTVVALDSLPSLVRSDFSGLFSDSP